MASDDVFDVIVIGAGPVGDTVARRAVQGGLTAVVVERRWVGGECNYYGCIPSKALLWPMELAAAVSRMPGLKLDGPIDAAAVMARRDDFVGHYQDAPQVSWIEKLPATFVRGQGRLAGPRQVEVTTPEGDTRALEARHAVVLATGSDPVVPDVPGLKDAHPWTNREATSVTKVPRRLVVIGGGPVACEMSQALRALGAEEVTLLVREDRLLSRNEPFAGELLAESFAESGIEVRFGRSAVHVERAAPGSHAGGRSRRRVAPRGRRDLGGDRPAGEHRRYRPRHRRLWRKPVRSQSMPACGPRLSTGVGSMPLAT